MNKEKLLAAFVLAGGLSISCPSKASENAGVIVGHTKNKEEVLYIGGRAQCGDLPSSHPCWAFNPTILYSIGGNQYNAILNCKAHKLSVIVDLQAGDYKYNVNPLLDYQQSLVDYACQLNEAMRQKPAKDIHNCSAFARMSGRSLSHDLPCEDWDGAKYGSFDEYCEAISNRPKSLKKLMGCSEVYFIRYNQKYGDS